MHLFEKYISTLLTGAAFIAVSTTDVNAQQQSAAFLNAPATDNGLRLNIGANGAYSDNLLRLSQSEIDNIDTIDITDQPEDYYVDVTGSIAFGRRIGRNQLSFDSSVGYRFHDNNTILDNERFSGRGVFAWQLGSRCSGGVGGQWLRDGGQFETLNDIVDNKQTTLVGGTQVQCNILGPLTLAGSAVLAKIDNSADSRSINDREDQFYSGSLRYRFGRGSYIGALVSSSVTDFTDDLRNPDVTPGAIDRFELLQYAGELNLTFGRGIRLNAQAGVTDIQNTANVDTSLTGFSGLVNVQLPIGSAHTVNLAASRSVQPLQSLTAVFARASDLAVGVNSSWSPRLSTQLTATYTERLIENDPAVADQNGPLTNTGDETLNLGFSVNYDLGRLIDLNLSYRYSKRSANQESFDFVSNTVLFGVRVKFN
jgi:hypothetical protein